jgi:hypothetical protein
MPVAEKVIGANSQSKPHVSDSDTNLVWQGKVGAFRAEAREMPERGDAVTLVVFSERGEILVNQPVNKPSQDDELEKAIALKKAGIRALDNDFYSKSGLSRILKV